MAAQPTPVRSALRLVRPRQWSKNALVFAAPLFAGGLGMASWERAGLAFLAMGLVSSATYVFNDLFDVERDRRHPTKRLRPLASGAVSKRAALGLGALLGLAGLALGAAMGRRVLLGLLVYVAIQAAYNLRLKRVAVADVFVVASGFVLRAVLGAAAVGVGISGWLLFCTGSLALMLGFAKRRHEFVLQGEDRSTSRESLVHYTRPALDALVVLFAASAAMDYAIYCLTSASAHRYPALVLTAPFVLYGVARYVLLVFSLDEGGEPADLLTRDPHLLASVGLFLLAAVLALGGLRLPLLEQ